MNKKIGILKIKQIIIISLIEEISKQLLLLIIKLLLKIFIC